MSKVNWTPDTFDLSDFTTATSTEVGPDEFSTVESIDIEKGEGFAFGQGTSRNPLQAEGSVTGDINDGVPAAITGKWRLEVVNSQNNPVEGGVIAQGRLSDLEVTRSSGPDGVILPYTDQEIHEPYKVALRIKTDSGTATYSSADSSFAADGFAGEVLG